MPEVSVRRSLVIPCYNEAKNLPALLARCGAVLAGPATELVLVDNGSTDDSAAVLSALLPRHPYARSIAVATNQGYGHGILAGLRAQLAKPPALTDDSAVGALEAS